MAFVRRALTAIVFALAFGDATAFWRMVCGTIQMGRIDPIITPGGISGHCHTIAGPINFNTTSTFDNLQAAYCTSCSVQKDKSAYWTPQLYYRHRNGTFEEVPHDGTVVYYLDRGVDSKNMVPFPKGYKVLSGDSGARSYDSKTLTYGNTTYKGEPIANRVSFACLDRSGPMPETPGFARTDCSSGLRAQIHFPSCWDGVNLYKSDQSHVKYLSGIDNGICPPTHPKVLPHLFFEIIYLVNKIDKSKGGMFVFANGDTTGYGFHGDFLNGWDERVLKDAVDQCMGDTSVNDGQIGKCPPLAASVDPYFSRNCPEQPPLVNETVKGLLKVLPGCNPPTGGPLRAAQNICPVQPVLNFVANQDFKNRSVAVPGDRVGSWKYNGCALNKAAPRPLVGASYSNSKNMTINSCTAFCKEKGYAMAGLEYSEECYCASALTQPIQDPVTCATQSYMICTGDNFQFCGGQGVTQIWEDTSYSGPPLKGIPVAGETKLALPGGGNATYVGCFMEGSGFRALSGTSYSNNTGMTLESCAAFCKRGNYKLFGTQYAQECYCGNAITTQQMAQNNCTSICTGDKTAFCGGGSRLSVYSLGDYVTPSPSASNTASGSQSPSTTTISAMPIPTASGIAYMDCYSETSPVRALAALFKSDIAMTVDMCAKLAQDGNYRYFGLEYASQCLAGNAINAGSSIIQVSKCNMACKGNGAQKCGGPNAISLYNNTLYVKPVNPNPVKVPNQEVEFAYKACYSEPANARALGATAELKASSVDNTKLTVEICAAFCYSKGLDWMGVENGVQCFCNGAGPINGATVSAGGDEDCNLPCAGNPRQNCGAPSKINVYQRKRGAGNSRIVGASQVGRRYWDKGS